MFHRLVPKTRIALAQAQSAAIRRGDERMDTRHLAIGVLGCGDEAVGSTIGEPMRSTLERMLSGGGRIGGGAPAPIAPKQLAPDAKRAIEGAAAEADLAGSTTIEPQHLLLALLRAEDGVLARALTEALEDRAAWLRRVESLRQR